MSVRITFEKIPAAVAEATGPFMCMVNHDDGATAGHRGAFYIRQGDGTVLVVGRVSGHAVLRPGTQIVCEAGHVTAYAEEDV